VQPIGRHPQPTECVTSRPVQREPRGPANGKTSRHHPPCPLTPHPLDTRVFRLLLSDGLALLNRT